MARSRSIRNFLVLVGIFSSGLVIALLLLNGLSPVKTRIACFNPTTGQTGLAARGIGSVVVSEEILAGSDRLEHRRAPQADLTCSAVFGKGWTDVR
jgi:hypothetical protein